MESFLVILARALNTALAPLLVALRSAEGMSELLSRFGWTVHLVDSSTMPGIASAFGLNSVFESIRQAVKELSDESSNKLVAAQRLIEAFRQVISIIGKFQTSPTAGLPYPLNQDKFWQETIPNLPDYLIADYLKRELPWLYGTLILVGILKATPVELDEPGRDRYVKYQLDWDVLGDIITAPDKALLNLYGFENSPSGFKYELFVSNLQQLLWALKIDAQFVELPVNQKGLRLLLFSQGSPADSTVVSLGLQLQAAYAATGANGTPEGLTLLPIASGTIQPTEAQEDGLYLEVEGAFEANDAFALYLRPTGLSIRTELPVVHASLAFGGTNSKSWILIGASGTHHLALGSFEIKFQVKGQVTNPELIAELTLGRSAKRRLNVVIQPSEGDGFLQKIVGTQPQRLEIEAGITWSSKTGLHFTGNAGFGFVLPIHKKLGVVDINTLSAQFERTNRGTELTLTTTGAAKLGPVSASIDRVGFKAGLVAAAPQKGNGIFGKYDLNFEFKPPTGIGLDIDAAGIIKGGGYLSADHAKGEYAGVLALTIKDTISLKAIAILTVTKPGQPANFSLFVLITAEFTSIPIGFGFTLNGIGGLFAVNRRMAIEALQAGVKTNALDSILFPQNPVANAPTILNNIRNFFPIEQGRFVFGLMVKIGWGTPTLLTIQAGVVLELPNPWKLVIMGQARIVLPNPEKPLVDLKMTVLGYIDTARSELGIDATLSGSRILTFSVSGDMLLRIRWGNDPLFVVSLGGFHHKFQPPPGLPKMDRMAISLADGDNPRIRLEAYLAITSNTVQFGANFDLYAGVSIWLIGKFSVSAYLGFDALFQFNPFYFIIEIRAGLSLCHNDRPVLEVKLFFELSGPNPWNANGYAEFHFIVKVRIGFNITIGKKKPELPRPIVNVVDELLKALANPANWSSMVIGNAPIKFREIESGDAVLVNPMSPLTVRQRVLPLNRRLDKFGESQPNAAGPFTIRHIVSGSVDILSKDGAPRDYFAPAQFFNFSNDEKLAQPNFEQFDCGAVADAGSTVDGSYGTYLEVDISYETAVIDQEELVDTQLYLPWLCVLLDTLHLGAAGQAALRTTGAAAFAGPNRGVVVVDMAYAVVERETMLAPQTIIHTTYIDARANVQSQPNYHVVGVHELMKPEG